MTARTYTREDVEAAVKRALDYAAHYCRSTSMDVPLRHSGPKLGGIYVPGQPADSGVHAGMGYADAIDVIPPADFVEPKP